MIYDKSITINTNLSLDNSKEKLKQLTFPYSKANIGVQGVQTR